MDITQQAPLRVWPATFSSERIRTSVLYSNDSGLADTKQQAPCSCHLSTRLADTKQQSPCPCHLSARLADTKQQAPWPCHLSARLTRFFTNQKLKAEPTSYELIYLQNNCQQLISKLRMSGAVSSLPLMPLLWEEVKGREHTDRQDLGGWNWVYEFLLINNNNNICGNKTTAGKQIARASLLSSCHQTWWKLPGIQNKFYTAQFDWGLSSFIIQCKIFSLYTKILFYDQV